MHCGLPYVIITVFTISYGLCNSFKPIKCANGDPSPTHAGVRQGCELMARLVCNMLQCRISVDEKDAVSTSAVRFAHDFLLFTGTGAEATTVLDHLARKLCIQFGKIIFVNGTV